MDEYLLTKLKKVIEGDIAYDEETLIAASHDASIFEIKPQVVVFPKDTNDVENLVKFAVEEKKTHPDLSLTARAAGTDMSGGPLNDSIIVAFGKYFNHLKSIKHNIATVEPGMYYRHFEDETLKRDLLMPSYPASKEICAIGGIVNNNSGGEKSLEFGKTEKYVAQIKAVLADGQEYTIHELTEHQLKQKIKKADFEGEIYRKIYQLVDTNYDLLQKARPKVSKNSAGYLLWNIYDKNNRTFDLAQLFVGAQGTLGLVTQVSFRLVPTRRFSEMAIIFLKDLQYLSEVIKIVLPLKPESFETYDDHTLKLAVKFFSSFAKSMGTKNIITTAWHFLPEFLMIATGGLPKLLLQVDFTSVSRAEIYEKIDQV